MKEENYNNKKTNRSKEEKSIVVNRLNRIEGQINGIKKMIQNDVYCNDVLVQLSAVEKSVRSVSNHILENHLYNCVTRELQDGNFDAIDEVIGLFKRFNK